jgi:hypothetical protein
MQIEGHDSCVQRRHRWRHSRRRRFNFIYNISHTKDMRANTLTTKKMESFGTVKFTKIIPASAGLMETAEWYWLHQWRHLRRRQCPSAGTVRATFNDIKSIRQNSPSSAAVWRKLSRETFRYTMNPAHTNSKTRMNNKTWMNWTTEA